ncbi:MAG: TetR/AcrR family transcriptional regulator [Candidatus Sericytochromatia bacterium]|nr:TetR/AcrR family transcriptional regulator [Candidatus Sericytochromatia bacterium]
MNTDKKILNEAIILFRKNGYHATSMNMVSEACGISKGNLTYHYPTKEELFKECIHASATYFKKYVLFSSFENQPSELDGLINFFKNVKTWLTYEGKIIGCTFSNAAIELRHSNSDLAEIPINYLREFKTTLKEKIESGQNNKNIVSKESADVMVEDLFLGYEGAVVYSRIENSLKCFDLYINRTYKYFKIKSP